MTLRFFLLFLLVLSGTYAHGQKTAEDYMEEARRLRSYQHQPTEGERKQHNSIILADYKYVVEQYPSSTLCISAYLGIAGIYEGQGREADAVAIYHVIMDQIKNAKTPKRPNDHRFSREGHEAAVSLCNYHEKRGNYDSAIYFLGQSDTVFRMFYGCGNAAAAGHEADIIRYADIYLEAQRVHDAETALLSNIVPDFFETADNIKTKLSSILKKYEQPGYLKSEMEIAVNNYFTDTAYYTIGGRTDKFISYGINFLGTKIGVFYDYERLRQFISESKSDITGLTEKEQVVACLKNSDVYKIIQEL